MDWMDSTEYMSWGHDFTFPNNGPMCQLVRFDWLVFIPKMKGSQFLETESLLFDKSLKLFAFFMVKRWCLWNMKLYETQFGLQYPKEIIKLTNLDFVRFESMAFLQPVDVSFSRLLTTKHSPKRLFPHLGTTPCQMAVLKAAWWTMVFVSFVRWRSDLFCE